MHRSRADDLAHSDTRHARQRSASPVLIYDGSCGFCTRAAQWLSRHADESAIDLRSSQDMSTRQLADLGLTTDQVNSSVWWIAGGASLNGHEAIGAALRNCRPGWKYLGQLIDVFPFHQFAPSTYRVIAHYRHLLPGATPACRVDASRADAGTEDSERG